MLIWVSVTLVFDSQLMQIILSGLQNVITRLHIHYLSSHPGMEQLRALGFKTVAMALTDDSISIDDPRLAAEEKLAILLGTEGDGLSDETIDGCDYTVKIPMYHGVDSLNVAAG